MFIVTSPSHEILNSKDKFAIYICVLAWTRTWCLIESDYDLWSLYIKTWRLNTCKCLSVCCAWGAVTILWALCIMLWRVNMSILMNWKFLILKINTIAVFSFGSVKFACVEILWAICKLFKYDHQFSQLDIGISPTVCFLETWVLQPWGLFCVQISINGTVIFLFQGRLHDNNKSLYPNSLGLVFQRILYQR